METSGYAQLKAPEAAKMGMEVKQTISTQTAVYYDTDTEST